MADSVNETIHGLNRNGNVSCTHTDRYKLATDKAFLRFSKLLLVVTILTSFLGMEISMGTRVLLFLEALKGSVVGCRSALPSIH